MSGTGEGVLGRAISGGRWAVFGLGVQKAVGFISFFILARLLAPADYGVMTVVLMMVGVLETLSLPGFERALIQKKGEIREYLDVFWTFNVLRALGISILIFLAAPFVGKFFHIADPLALNVLRLSGFLVLINALGNLGSLFFFKELEFKNLFWRDMAGQAAFVAAAVGWALFHPTVFALFLGYLARNIAAVFIQYFLHPHRPRFSFYFSRLRDLASFGFWAMGQNVLNQANSILQTTFVGRFLGTAELGLYSRATSIVSLPSSALFSIVSKVGFPAYSRVQDSREKVMSGFVKSFDVAFLTTVPFLFLILTSAEGLVLVLLGAKWVGMVGAMKVLVPAFTLEGFAHITYPLLEGIGRPDLRAKLSFLRLAFLFPLLLYLAPRGIVFAALALLITSAVLFLATAFWVFRRLKPSFSRLAAPVLSVLGSCFLTISLAYPFYSFFWNAGLAFYVLFLLAAGLVYFLSLLFLASYFKDGPYQTLRLIFRQGGFGI